MNRIALLALAGVTLGLGAAHAQVDCSTLPNPVYFPATTDIRPTLARIAPALATAAEGQMTVIYRSLSSCIALDYVLNDTDLDGTAVYWTGNTTAEGAPEEGSCVMPAGIKASLAASDISVRTCRGEDPAAGISEFQGFVQTFNYVVPPNSSQNAITAAEGYFLMKFGGAEGYQVPPWTNPALVMIRTPAASTQLVIGLAIGVLGTQWSANLTNINQGSGDVVTKVAAENTTGQAEATIGILSSQRYDQERARLKALAFQAYGQCLGGFYADSTPTAIDKRNVRDGHYPIWAYLQLVTKTTGGVPNDANAQRVIDILQGREEVAGVNTTEAIIRAGAVPECAMAVTRPYDGGPLAPSTPAAPCGCFYDFTTTGATTCTACPTGTECGAGVCRLGYCEAR